MFYPFLLTFEINKQILLLWFWCMWGCICTCRMVYISNSNDLLTIKFNSLSFFFKTFKHKVGRSDRMGFRTKNSNRSISFCIIWLELIPLSSNESTRKNYNEILSYNDSTTIWNGNCMEWTIDLVLKFLSLFSHITL